MNYGCKRRLISVYFIGIIIGFILGEIEKNINQNIEQATFGAGCFWCVEAVFTQLPGVQKVVSGYTGGSTLNPTYESICTGTTGHVEVCRITFDPEIISYERLLEVLFVTHDPTTLNQQGADKGTQYRSAVFYTDDNQKTITKALTRIIIHGSGMKWIFESLGEKSCMHMKF